MKIILIIIAIISLFILGEIIEEYIIKHDLENRYPLFGKLRFYLNIILAIFIFITLVIYAYWELFKDYEIDNFVHIALLMAPLVILFFIITKIKDKWNKKDGSP